MKIVNPESLEVQALRKICENAWADSFVLCVAIGDGVHRDVHHLPKVGNVRIILRTSGTDTMEGEVQVAYGKAYPIIAIASGFGGSCVQVGIIIGETRLYLYLNIPTKPEYTDLGLSALEQMQPKTNTDIKRYRDELTLERLDSFVERLRNESIARA